MDPIAEFGPYLVEYSGTANVTYRQGEQEIVYEGTFEARQLESARVVVVFRPVSQHLPSGGATFRITNPPARDRDVVFEGHTGSGWRLTPYGSTLEQPILGPMLPSGHQVFVWTHLRAGPEGIADTDVSSARFLISFPRREGSLDYLPREVSFEARGIEVSVDPSEGFSDPIRLLPGPYQPKADVGVMLRNSSGRPASLQCYADYMDDVVSALRLATGSGIEWYYGEAIDHQTGHVLGRLHKGAIHGPASNTLRNAGSPIELDRLIPAIVSHYDRVLQRATLRSLINYFVAVCEPSAPLEMKGLEASALFELIVNQYHDAQGTREIIPDDEFASVHSKLADAVRRTELSHEQQRHLIDYLRGGYRSSFGRKLRGLVNDLQLTLNSKLRGRVVKIRNETVHRGTYPSERSAWLNDYHLLIWFDFVALCRLAGYEGALPSPHQDWMLDV